MCNTKSSLVSIVVPNMHAPIDDYSDDMKDGVYDELERVLHQCPKRHKRVLLGDFKMGQCISCL
jgi:hypothetical protein